MSWQLLGLALIPVVGVAIGKAISFLVNKSDEESSPSPFVPPMYASFDAHRADSRERKEEMVDEVRRHLAL